MRAEGSWCLAPLKRDRALRRLLRAGAEPLAGSALAGDGRLALAPRRYRQRERVLRKNGAVREKRRTQTIFSWIRRQLLLTASPITLNTKLPPALVLHNFIGVGILMVVQPEIEPIDRALLYSPNLDRILKGMTAVLNVGNYIQLNGLILHPK